MSITSRQRALLRVALNQLGNSDAEYRCALVQIAGVETSLDLDRESFNALMGYFEWRGFTPLQAKGPNYGAWPGMATFAQIEFIRSLWQEFTKGAAGEAELNKWLERCFKRSSLRFVTKP
jgi:hypothetical protein